MKREILFHCGVCFVQGKREHGPVLGQGQNQRRAVCIQGSAVCQLALPVAELAQGRSLLRIQRNRHLCTRNTFAKLCTQRHCARSAAGHRRLLRQPLYTHIRPGRRVAGAASSSEEGAKLVPVELPGALSPSGCPSGWLPEEALAEELAIELPKELPEELPEYVQLIRSWSGSPEMMVEGLDSSFDAAFFVGYHNAAGEGGNALSHTINGGVVHRITVNGQPASEFLI